MKQRTLPWIVHSLTRRNRIPETGAGFPELWSRTAPPPRILVVRQDNRLGNLILMIPFLRALRKALPTAEVALLSGDAYADLVDSFPWVDRWIVQEKRRHAKEPWLFPAWLKRLRATPWDAAFEMSNHNTHSYFNCVLTAASGAPLRIGFDEPRNANTLTLPVPPPDSRLPFALAPLELLRGCGLPADAAPPSLQPEGPPSPRLSAFRRDDLGDSPYALIHVGGRGGKSWPLESWTRLVPKIRRLGGPRIVLIGGPDEIERMETLRKQGHTPESGDTGEVEDDAMPAISGWPEIVAPLFGLSDLACLLRGAAYYIGCDTGVMHMAAAVGTPTVALFFRSNPLHYAPLGSRHCTVLLADPYHAAGGQWEAPLPGLERSRLRVVPTRPEDSASGVPVTGAEADSAILEAISEALSRISEMPDAV